MSLTISANNRGGTGIIWAMFMIFISSIGCIAMHNYTSQFASLVKRQLAVRQAAYYADAAIEYGYWQYAKCGNPATGRYHFNIELTDDGSEDVGVDVDIVKDPGDPSIYMFNGIYNDLQHTLKCKNKTRISYE
jgi:hypothetical protein